MKLEDIARYVGQLADELRLRDWEYVVRWERESDELTSTVEASAKVRYEQQVAEIIVPKKFKKDTPEGQRHTLLHEMLHVKFGRSINWVEAMLDELLPPAQSEKEWKFFCRVHEPEVDSLASALAPKMPLPDWK